MELNNKWVGLVEVRQQDGVDLLGNNKGAHVTVVAWCEDETGYESVVGRALSDDGLEVIATEEVERCEHRYGTYEVDDRFRDAVDQVNPTNPVVFMDFHTFPLEEN